MSLSISRRTARPVLTDCWLVLSQSQHQRRHPRVRSSVHLRPRQASDTTTSSLSRSAIALRADVDSARGPCLAVALLVPRIGEGQGHAPAVRPTHDLDGQELERPSDYLAGLRDAEEAGRSRSGRDGLSKQANPPRDRRGCGSLHGRLPAIEFRARPRLLDLAHALERGLRRFPRLCFVCDLWRPGCVPSARGVSSIR